MSYGGAATTKRNQNTLVGIVTTVAESIGLLNKGSAKTPAAPEASETSAKVEPVSSNTLNVTRVGGITTLIAAAGGAALVIFNVNKSTDKPPIVVAAYLSVGAIVVAALLTVAIIIASDIRARAAIATAVSPTPPLRDEVKHVVAKGATDNVVSLDRAYDYVLIDADAAKVILTLPTADSSKWQQMEIRREDNSKNKVTIRPQGQETVANARTQDVAATGHLHIYSNGVEWVKVQ